MSEAYDYVIIGGGTTGAVIAERLSENPHVTVLLIERGGTNWEPWHDTYYGSLLSLVTRNEKIVETVNESIEETDNYSNGTKDGSIPLWYGKGLGGTSIVAQDFYEQGTESEWNNFLSKFDLTFNDIKESYDTIH